MKSILCPSPDVVSPAWTALQLLLERQHDLRWLWIKPGGYFFTKAGNRRKVIRTKLIPRIITVTLRDRLAHAERIYYESLKSGIFGYGAIEVATLALAGCITGTPPVKRRSLRKQYEQHKRRFRLWPPTRTNSLRYLCRIGFLQQPRDSDPRI
jgi:hypothetical protein